ncbi:AtpZ/AtpI family protein [Peptostreptococcus equinus]|uniref:AtpZ/AtpI family protein n=1 Tax=Peptostreptococcus equinus TaxID=3003601 RepID=A0ABY7JQ97_9FIRM|nr:AtpZ/AtpI family protein [Peptostreptococcus sp. CBA3647]WAW15066.1 AtpZ/AtpI family protein [Peptostreptococcus sp. CBA3647]
MSDKKGWVKISKSFSLLTQLSVMMLVCILGCAFIGITIDKKFGTSPIFSIIFIIIGVASAFLSLYKTLKTYYDKGE